MKRKLLSLFVALLLLCTSYANAEINMINGTDVSNGMSFRVSYDSNSRTYWAMTHVVKKLFGITVGHWYRVYQISENMEDVSLAFRTPHAIYDIVATSEGLFYEREIFLVGTAVDVYYYDTENHSNKNAVLRNEIVKLYGEVNNSALYYRSNVGLCLYDTTTDSETVIVRNAEDILWDNTSLFYKISDGSKFAYQLQTGDVISAEYPDNVSQISNGYMLDVQNALLYTPDNTVVSVSFIEGADAVSLRDGFLCSQRLSSNGEGRILSCISLDNPEEIIRIDIPLLIDQNINIQNGNAFFYTKQENKLMIIAVNLSSGTTKTIVLP